jgi:hypothetical protein
MASSSSSRRFSAAEALRNIMLDDDSSDDFDDDLGNDDSSGEDDNVVSDLTSDDGSENESSRDSELDDATASAANSVTAPSGKQWKLQVPRQTRTTAANISLPSSLTGVSLDVETILDAFKLFISQDMLDTIINCTNKYGSTKVADWHDVDDIEMLGFIGLLLLRGVCRARRESIDELWSTDGSFTRPIFPAVMSRARFKQLLRYLKFDDPETRNERAANDKLAALRDIYEMFARNCRETFRPGQYLTIDEQLVNFRGRCSFKVYIPSKPGKYGLKVWVICDAETSYCCNLQVYTGKVNDQPERNQASRVVKELAEYLLDNGRNITMDNFFTSVPLAEDLLARRTTLVGTLRKNKRDIPKSFSDAKGRTVYSTSFAYCGQLTLCSYCPKKNKVIPMLSSMHHDAAVSNEPERKPDIILCYNQTKSGVDNLDKLVKEYSTRSGTRRWPMVLFLSWLDIAAYNALVVYTFNFPDQLQKNRARYKFLKQLGKSLTKPLMDRRMQAVQQNPKSHKKRTRQLLELCGAALQQTNEQVPAVDNRKRGRCFYCVGSDKKHSKICNNCSNFFCDGHGTVTTTAVCHSCNAAAETGESSD